MSWTPLLPPRYVAPLPLSVCLRREVTGGRGHQKADPQRVALPVSPMTARSVGDQGPGSGQSLNVTAHSAFSGSTSLRASHPVLCVQCRSKATPGQDPRDTNIGSEVRSTEWAIPPKAAFADLVLLSDHPRNGRVPATPATPPIGRPTCSWNQVPIRCPVNTSGRTPRRAGRWTQGRASVPQPHRVPRNEELLPYQRFITFPPCTITWAVRRLRMSTSGSLSKISKSANLPGSMVPS